MAISITAGIRVKVADRGCSALLAVLLSAEGSAARAQLSAACRAADTLLSPVYSGQFPFSTDKYL
jgi:hypothetical protein